MKSVTCYIRVQFRICFVAQIMDHMVSLNRKYTDIQYIYQIRKKLCGNCSCTAHFNANHPLSIRQTTYSKTHLCQTADNVRSACINMLKDPIQTSKTLKNCLILRLNTLFQESMNMQCIVCVSCWTLIGFQTSCDTSKSRLWEIWEILRCMVITQISSMEMAF